MEAREVRIGNYVYRQNGKNGNKDDMYQIENVNRQSAHKYDPIPLTEEWLLKFGFYESHGEYRIDYRCERLSVNKSISFEYLDDDRFYFVNDTGVTIGKNIRFVHQLQNIHFALTGEELKLKHTATN